MNSQTKQQQDYPHCSSFQCGCGGRDTVGGCVGYTFQEQKIQTVSAASIWTEWVPWHTSQSIVHIMNM